MTDDSRTQTRDDKLAQTMPVAEKAVEIKTPDGTAEAMFIHPTTGTHPGVLCGRTRLACVPRCATSAPASPPRVTRCWSRTRSIDRPRPPSTRRCSTPPSTLAIRTTWPS